MVCSHELHLRLLLLQLLAMAAAVTGIVATRHRQFPFPPLQVGVTHVQDWEPWSRHPESVQRAVALMKEGVVTWQNQGIIGGGGMWLPAMAKPNTTDPNDGYDWSHLDYRVQAMRNASSAGGRMVLRLFDAPGWMVNMTSRWNTTKVGNAPLRRDRYDDFAHLCAGVASRYPDVTHFEVWNELNGFLGNWSFAKGVDGMTADAPAYTELFIKVSAAIKRVNPLAKVGGPYVPITAGQLPPGRASACSGGWGAINPALLNFVQYFVLHAKGHYDFFSMDGHLAYEAYQINGTHYTRPANGDPLGSTAVFPAATKWVREQSGLDSSIPIWWSEFYPVPCVDTGMYGPSEQLWPLDLQRAVYRKMLTEISDPALGVEVALNWAAQASANCPVAVYNDTSLPNGGYPTPFYSIIKDINHAADPSDSSGGSIIPGSSAVRPPAAEAAEAAEAAPVAHAGQDQGQRGGGKANIAFIVVDDLGWCMCYCVPCFGAVPSGCSC